MSPGARFDPRLRRERYHAFDLTRNSSARRTRRLQIGGEECEIYANANLSIYSAQTCNAACPFCVEELRPATRGIGLAEQKKIERDDQRWFAALERAMTAVAPLGPSTSITGGEPSLDPRLPETLRRLQRRRMRKRTLTTNGSGLLLEREGRRLIDWITACGIAHLNISRAHWDEAHNARLMRLDRGIDLDGLREVVAAARSGGTRVRLSCALLRDGVATLGQIRDYCAFAEGIGVDNLVFRQLMLTDPGRHAGEGVIGYSDTQRVPLTPILDAIGDDPEFRFQRQVVGYYYYVEVWRYRGMDLVFEEADLAQLERTKQGSRVIHELVFHPDGTLASTWQPWDGVLLRP